MYSETKVRKMLPGEEDKLVQILVNAFHSDPIAVLVEPDESTRDANYYKRFRQVIDDDYWVETTDDYAGVAVWKHFKTKSPMDHSDMNMKAKQVFDWVDENAPQPPYWYLAFLAATKKGNGVGSKLIKHRLEQFNSNETCALWTGNESTIGFYEKFGFKLHCHQFFDSVGAWWMIRK